MSGPPSQVSTGIPALDGVLDGLRPGDNVVWQVEAIADYTALARPFVARARQDGRRVVYHRFARHAPLATGEDGVEVHALSAALGFESFTAAIHRRVTAAGRGAFHLFDLLSDLAADWYSDLMLGNFFTVTCPYLYELDTVAYFALLRESHTQEAVDAVRRTTQVLADVFRQGRTLHVHPHKVQGRYAPTMYLPHAWEGDGFRALTSSAELAEALAEVSERRLDAAARPDLWDRRVQAARDVHAGLRAGTRSAAEAREAFEGLLRMMLTRDERFAALAARYLDLPDLFAVRRRMIGTGLVGGKAAGMLVARAILAKTQPHWARRLEPHDSWFIGSDVYYTYLVQSGAWSARGLAHDPASALAAAEEARARVLRGAFPPSILQQFMVMLEAYGQSPIIVRSSSLLEDGFGNAFTGKYESVFCANQGAPEERLRAFVAAVQQVYASALGAEALRYRERRGLLDRDEQMAVLVQRVSGAVQGSRYYPQAAGVALSYNPYVWNAAIDPQAGVVRLVFGMGTRAVERSDDDYTRVVALNAPQLRPESSVDEVNEYAQRRVDLIDLAANRLTSLPIDEVLAAAPELPVAFYATFREPGHRPVLTFDELLWGTPLVDWLREMLGILRAAYGCQVDVEFTFAVLRDGSMRLNLVQCRPLQVREGGVVGPRPAVGADDVVLRSAGPVVGRSSQTPIDRVVYVDPDAYTALGTRDRHEVARVVGRVCRATPPGARVLLLGPGRWGTTTPSLGVPVRFAEIQRVSALCEIMRLGDVIPDVSLGSHFFNDLVEEDMLYLALYPRYEGHHLDEARLRAEPNRLAELSPDDARMAMAVHVLDFAPASGRGLWLHADCVGQEVVCYLAPERES